MVLDAASRTVRFTFSDGSVDRYGDTITADGWDLRSFLKNPVALFAHDSVAPPIGRAVNVLIEGARLKRDIEFMDADTYPLADTIFKMVKGGGSTRRALVSCRSIGNGPPASHGLAGLISPSRNFWKSPSCRCRRMRMRWSKRAVPALRSHHWASGQRRPSIREASR